MSRRTVAASVFVILVARVAGQPTFSTRVDLVRLDIAVTRNDQPIANLRAPDFEIVDRDVKQKVEWIVQESAPLDVALVLDVSSSVRGRTLENLQRAADEFVGRLSSGDLVSLFTFSHRVARRQGLSLDRARTRSSLKLAEAHGATALRDAIWLAVRGRRASDLRPAVVVFSDGEDTRSWLDEDELVEAVRRSEPVVYAVRALAKPGGADPRAQQLLSRVTEITGGRLWQVSSPDALAASFVQVLAHIRSRYVVAYYPTGVDREGWHDVRVRVKDVRAEITSRKGYWVGKTRPRDGQHYQEVPGAPAGDGSANERTTLCEWGLHSLQHVHWG